MICCPGLRSLKATWFINVCAGECNRYIITGDALLKSFSFGEMWRATGEGGGGNGWMGMGGQDVVCAAGRLWVWVGV